MCIINDDYMVVKVGELVLWKVVKRCNDIGLWYETMPVRDECISFCVGEQVAHDYHPRTDTGMGYETFTVPGAFHCCLTRKAARTYLKYRKGSGGLYGELKIIKVYAASNTVVSVGVDKYCKISAISVSKMTIKSLKHQR